MAIEFLNAHSTSGLSGKELLHKGSTVAQVGLQPHSSRDPGSVIISGAVCEELARFPCDWVDSSGCFSFFSHLNNVQGL